MTTKERILADLLSGAFEFPMEFIEFYNDRNIDAKSIMIDVFRAAVALDHEADIGGELDCQKR